MSTSEQFYTRRDKEFREVIGTDKARELVVADWSRKHVQALLQQFNIPGQPLEEIINALSLRELVDTKVYPTRVYPFECNLRKGPMIYRSLSKSPHAVVLRRDDYENKRGIDVRWSIPMTQDDVPFFTRCEVNEVFGDPQGVFPDGHVKTFFDIGRNLDSYQLLFTLNGDPFDTGATYRDHIVGGSYDIAGNPMRLV